MFQEINTGLYHINTMFWALHVLFLLELKKTLFFIFALWICLCPRLKNLFWNSVQVFEPTTWFFCSSWDFWCLLFTGAINLSINVQNKWYKDWRIKRNYQEEEIKNITLTTYVWFFNFYTSLCKSILQGSSSWKREDDVTSCWPWMGHMGLQRADHYPLSPNSGVDQP